MKPDAVIVSVNENPLYAGFAKLIPAAWAKLGFRCHVVQVTEATRPPFIHTCAWSQISRIMRYQDACEPDEILMVSDIDLLPLNAEPFETFPEIEPGQLLCYGYDAYEDQGMRRKFPGCYMAAHCSTWKQITNPLDLNDFDAAWWNIRSSGKADPGFLGFCEETLIKQLVDAWNPDRSAIVPVNRGWDRMGSMVRAHRRIDRAAWAWSLKELRAGKYIDAHLPRPLALWDDEIMQLVNAVDRIKDGPA